MTGAREKLLRHVHGFKKGSSDHPKCKDWWSLTRGGRLQESNHRGSLSRRGPGTPSLWKIIYCMQCLSQDMCRSMLSLKFLVYSK